jgi:hypothetical protein
MEYAVELSLQGGDLLQPIAERVLFEMGEMRDGPGEEEMERLTAAVTPVISLLLEQMENLPETATLTLGLEGDATHLRLDLRLTGAGGGEIPQSLVDPLLPPLQQAFDRVEGPEAAAGDPFHIVLTRHPSS